jgi:beta-lactamase class D
MGDDLVKQDNAILIHSTFKIILSLPLEQRKILSYEPTEYNKQQATADAYMWSVYGLGLKAEKN